MTTAPTPSEAERIASLLKAYATTTDSDLLLLGETLLEAAELLTRLQVENERMRSAERTLQRLGYQDRGGQEWAPPIGQAPDFDLIDSLRSRIAELEARKPLPLSDEQIDAIADGMPGGLGGFMKTWGWRQFARKILELRAPPTWEPQFDCMAPGQEELAIQFCAEIAGPRGKPGRNPDPVRLLEMAQALYKAEADAHGITGGSS